MISWRLENLIDIDIIGDAVKILLKIRREACDGSINVPMQYGTDTLVRFLETKKLIKNKRIYDEDRHYMRLSEKGKLLLEVLGVN